MEFDFRPTPQSLYIPKDVYQPIKKCPFCHSVYITDTRCEACDRAIDYNLIGMPFSSKSYYRIKEKYLDSLPTYVKFYPIFEDKKSEAVKSYTRNIIKRFNDLLLGFSSSEIMKSNDRKLFYIEAKEIIDELMEYGYSSIDLNKMAMEFSGEDLVLQDLLNYIHSKRDSSVKILSWEYLLLQHRLFGFLKVEFILKAGIVLAAVIFAALKLRFFFFN